MARHAQAFTSDKMMQGFLNYAGTLNLHLCKNSPVMGAGQDATLFTQPDFGGYAPKTLAYPTLVTDYDTGITTATFRTVAWYVDSIGTAETVTGWFVTDLSNNVLYFYGTDELSKTFAAVDDGIALQLSIRVNPLDSF